MKKMFKKFYFLNRRNRGRLKTLFKQESGLTLIEVIIALLIIAVITVVLVRGTIVSVDALQVDRTKTMSLAVANEKLELLKNMEYDDIKLLKEEDGTPYDEWLEDHPELTEEDYDIEYSITWVDGEEYSYKQVELTIFKEPMKMPVKIITQVYPAEGEHGFDEDKYPSPENLLIEYDTGISIPPSAREIKLVWDAPDTELEIDRYHIYIDGVFLDNSYTESYFCYPGNNYNHSFCVTAFYAEGIESDASNTVTTELEIVYTPPQNLQITEYSGGGMAYKVYLAWEEPELPTLMVIEYNIYRDTIWIDSTTDLTFQNTIGKDDYTFYVTAKYEDFTESEPSNEVTTTH
jgi:prepilin-type N-terminal cleavage/methylation domain-containing protein